jgi:hypothetical protein
MPIFIPEDAIQKAVNEYNKNSLDTTAAKTNLLIGYPMPFNISAEQSTKLTMITGETLRKLTICAKGAAGLTLIFSELSLVHGSKMIIYDESGCFMAGPIDGDDFQNTKTFTTGIFPGSTINIEIFEPIGVNKSRFQIEYVGYIINDKIIQVNPSKQNEPAKSASCEINVKCPLGFNLYDQRDGIARISHAIPGYGYFGFTGALLNNNSIDFTPYILTAFHCLDGDGNSVLDSLEKACVSNMVFDFFFESPSCNSNQSPTSYVSYSGATFKAAYTYTDFALVQMTTNSIDCRHYFLGWDATSSMPTDLYCLHHPNYEVMKVSRDDNGTWANNFGLSIDEIWLPANYAHVIDWSDGVTEPGSSGSPFINQYNRVVGQLSGGWAICFSSIGYDYGGRLYYSWNTGGSSDLRLKDWLDPTNTNVLTRNGIRHGGISGPTGLCSEGTYQFSLINPPSGVSVTWTASPESFFNQSSGSGTTANLTVNSSAHGSGLITFTVPHPTKGTISFSLPIYFSDMSGAVDIHMTGENYEFVEIINGMYSLCPNTTYRLQAIPNFGGGIITDWDWTIPESWELLSSENYPEILIQTGDYLYWEDEVHVDIYNSICNTWTYCANYILTQENPYGECDDQLYQYIIFPNPVNNILTIEKVLVSDLKNISGVRMISEISDYKTDANTIIIKIFDNTGLKFESKYSDESKFVLNVSNLPKGMYFIQLITSNKVYKQKLLIWH